LKTNRFSSDLDLKKNFNIVQKQVEVVGGDVLGKKNKNKKRMMH
jgi:hypothetical protein